MKIILYPVLMAAAILTMTSCDSFLDKGPEENLSLEETFKERAYVDRFLNNMYSGLPMEMNFHELPALNPFVGGCDEMEITTTVSQTHLINQSSLNAANDWAVWGNSAVFSRKCNLFLHYIQYTSTSVEEKTRWIGEAHFLRAMYSFVALRMYGAIPQWARAYDINEDFTKMERATFEECVKFITDDCDAAFSRLPARQGMADYGRASAAAALALKARVLLYAASPLYNGNPDYENLKNAAGDPMYPTYSRERWATAAEAAKRCIDFCEGNLPGTTRQYRLYTAMSGDPVDSHYELFIKNWNDEVLFARSLGINQLFDKCIAILGLNGLAQYAPTQQIVDAYRMSDGKNPFTLDGNGEVTYNASGQPTVIPSSGYTETGFTATASPKGYWNANVSNMYVNREPRFYAHINFCGSVWQGLSSEFWYSGRDGASKGANHSMTGYLIRKFADKNTNILNVVHNNRTWIFFRLAEMYLDYAEALNEAHDVVQPDVYIYLNAVRTRAGLPEITGSLTPGEMRILIRQERHTELAFETHRFFDTRRWKIAEETDGKPIYGMNIGVGTGLTDPAFYQRTMVEKRKFIAPRNYLFPIQQSEREIDPMLQQNPGY